MRGRNFDDVAEKLSRNIYGTTRGQLRQTVLWQDLDKLLADYAGQTLRVLGADGREGQTAILMTQRGHHVVLCDPPAGMVVQAQRATEEQSVSDNMHLIHCTAQDIPQHLDSQIDLILSHTMLEWVVDSRTVLKILRSMLRPGGALSLMLCNAGGLPICDVLVDNFDYVQRGMYKGKRRTLFPNFPCDP